jgi:Flp pilus assembly secretin CpaC
VIASIHDGFSLQLTPRLLDDGRILLQYSLSLIGLDTLGSTSFAGMPLDLPVTDNRLFVQQSMLRSGQTLMIGGVDQEKMSQNKQGVGSPDNFLLGGGTSSDTTHLMLFMSITPQVMDIADEEHS